MNITFLNPAFLWALPLALAPLIIHLFFKKHPNKIYFSDLRFISLAIEKIKAGFRLKQLLLLATRMLIIFFLIFFFSRPVWQKGKEDSVKEKDSKLSIIILLDSSYSMGYLDGGKTRFEDFKSIAKRIISITQAKNRIGIISYSNKIEAATPSLSNDREYLTRLIDNINISNRPTDFSVTVALINQLVKQIPDSQNILIILSDLASHGFKTKIKDFNVDAKIICISPEKSNNVAVSEVDPDFDSAGQIWILNNTIDNFSSESFLSRPIGYLINNSKKGNDLIGLSGNNKLYHRFIYPDNDTDLFGYVNLIKDSLQIDDRFYFSSKRSPPYKIWIIDGSPKSGGVTAESFYLRNVFPQAEIFPESELDKINFSLPGVVILANIRQDNIKIENFISSGGGALLFLGNQYSEQFQPSYLPANVGSEFGQNQNVIWLSENHPLRKNLNLDEFEWDKIVVEKGFVLQPNPHSQVLAGFSSGWPFLVEANYENGKVIMCSSTADSDWNNMITRPIYAPLFKGIVHYLSGISNIKDKLIYKIGDTISHYRIEKAEIISPVGQKTRPNYIGDEITFNDTEIPGIYKLLSKNKEVTRFAVNPDVDSGESNLDVLNSGEIKIYFSDKFVMFLDRNNWEKEFIAVLSGIDITRVILMILFLLILFEILLANPKIRN